ncbi:SRPBCC family protein [Actinokineospora spheciospongiae]|uniref:SRPBCC family protein n=1 Tax=Actinokineospora spheciospongiae TaxID=909613 RepID=UPI000D709F7E|nr:SRPBCC family protein [Actinokineospora spheciospongiae]PWW62727.1 ribosome-associated toxin RatA of RatAB toxin-antitoxin module [Actinokineospora spheciospongiae]
MCHYSHTATAAVPADEVFAYLADVRHLPEFFPRMVSAEPVGEQPSGNREVAIETDVDGERVAAKAWVLVDPETRSLRWGADGPNDYHGCLQVTDIGAGECSIEVSLHTARTDDPDIQSGIEMTVAQLTQAVAAA